MTEKVTTEDRGAVRIVRINRPDQRNCVDGDTAAGLGRAIDSLAGSPSADQAAQVATAVSAVDQAVKGFVSATDSEC